VVLIASVGVLKSFVIELLTELRRQPIYMITQVTLSSIVSLRLRMLPASNQAAKLVINPRFITDMAI
jgi:hypothetical protein